MGSDQLAERRKPIKVGPWEIPYRPHGKPRPRRPSKSSPRSRRTHLGDAGGFRWSVTTSTSLLGDSATTMRFVSGWVRLPCSLCGREWQCVINGSVGLPPDFRSKVAAYLQGGCGACAETDHDKKTCHFAGDWESDPKWCRECCHDKSIPTGVPWDEEEGAPDA